MIASPGPVINADDVRWYRRRAIVSANGSQQRIIAHRESETICKSGRRATTQCESEMANQTVQACCTASHGANYAITETLGENLSAAIAGTTDEASDGQVQLDAVRHRGAGGCGPAQSERCAGGSTGGGRGRGGIDWAQISASISDEAACKNLARKLVVTVARMTAVIGGGHLVEQRAQLVVSRDCIDE